MYLLYNSIYGGYIKMIKKILSIILTLTVLLSVVPMRVIADEIVLGDAITWEISDDGTLTINGTGAINPVSNYKSFWESEYNDVIKKLVVNDGITEIGGYVFSKLTNLNEATIADSVKVISYGVFSQCTALKTVSLPSEMTTISTHAFSGCTSLENINMPKTLTNLHDMAFNNCSSLKSIDIPEGLEEIRSQTFANCTSLTEVTIPSTVTSISDNVFSGCTSLKSITLPKSANYLSDYALAGMENLEEISLYGDLGQLQLIDGGLATNAKFILYPAKMEGTLDLPSTISSLSAYAFNNCQGLTALTINSSMGYPPIPYSSFGGCTSLKEITGYYTTLSTVITYIKENNSINAINILDEDTLYSSKDGVVYTEDFKTLVRYPWGRTGAYTVLDGTEEVKDVFLDATGLTAITFPDTLVKLHASFTNCDLIEEISLPASLTSLYVGAFSGVSSLKKITIDENNTSFKVIDNIVYTKDGETLYTAIGGLEGDIVVPDGVTTIGSSAFSGSEKITSVILPQTVETIKADAFKDCIGLERIEMPKTLKKLESGIFTNCKSLKTVTIPDGITSLASTFSGCESLESIIIPDGVTTLNQTFRSCTSLKSIEIPETLININSMSFWGCSSLDNVVIHAQIKTIGSNAFSGCTSLKELVISEGVKTISDNAFSGCTSLCEVTIPSTVTALYNNAFNGCDSLNDVYYIGTKMQYNRPLLLTACKSNNTLYTSCTCFIVNTYDRKIRYKQLYIIS